MRDDDQGRRRRLEVTIEWTSEPIGSLRDLIEAAAPAVGPIVAAFAESCRRAPDESPPGPPPPAAP